jgi:hypothetical protein
MKQYPDTLLKDGEMWCKHCDEYAVPIDTRDAEIERLKAINAELVAACVGVVNLWHKNAWSVSNPYYKKIQAALEMAKGE